jgi:hypothetical protein
MMPQHHCGRSAPRHSSSMETWGCPCAPHLARVASSSFFSICHCSRAVDAHVVGARRLLISFLFHVTCYRYFTSNEMAVCYFWYPVCVFFPL